MCTRRFRTLALCLFAAWSGTACAGDHSAEADADTGDRNRAHEVQTADYTTFDVQWRDDAAILDDVGQVQAALVRADYERGEFVFSPDLPGIEALQAGRAAVIGGIGVLRVVSRERVDGGELVKVEVAKLTDVIEDGTIAWRRSFVSAAADAKLGVGDDADEARNIAALAQALTSYEAGKLSFSGKVSDFDTTFSIEHAASGLDMELSTKYSKDNATAKAVVTGRISALTNESTIRIQSRALDHLSVKFLDVQGEVKIEGGAAEVAIPDVRVQVPARLSLPVVIGGIPFRIDVGGSLEWVSTLEANTSARLNGTASFQGGVGAVYDGADVTPLATFKSSDVKIGEVEQVGTVAAGLDLLMNFPELSVGVGVANVAEAKAAFKFKTESITNLSLRYKAAGIAPVVTGSCLRSRTNFGATLISNASLLGFELLKDETSLFADFGQESAHGNACD